MKLGRPLRLRANLVSKQRQKLVAKIPDHVPDSTVWKQKIYDAVREAQRVVGVSYSDKAKLDVEVRFYFRGHKLTKLDLDNLLKHVGDALQGFINDKGAGKRKPIIPNDNQIYRLTAEKRLPSKRYPDALSTITIRRYDRDARTVADPRETRKHV
jgi:Holliday junction resolvase RusA-like endonuclease